MTGGKNDGWVSADLFFREVDDLQSTALKKAKERPAYRHGHAMGPQPTKEERELLDEIKRKGGTENG